MNTVSQSSTPKGKTPMSEMAKPENPKKKLSDRQKARRMVLQALYQWQLAGAPVSDIQAEFRSYYLGKIDWAYFNEVFPAIPPRVKQLDAALIPMLPMPQLVPLTSSPPLLARYSGSPLGQMA